MIRQHLKLSDWDMTHRLCPVEGYAQTVAAIPFVALPSRCIAAESHAQR